MRIFPRLRGANQTADSPSAAGSSVRRHLLAACVLLMALVASFYMLFPESALEERIEYEVARGTGVELDLSGLRLLFPPGLSARKAVLQDEALPVSAPELSALRVKPLWSTLMGDDPGIAFDARLLGGTVGGTALRNGEVEAQLEQVSYSAPLMAGSSLAVAATLSKGSFRGRLPLHQAKNSRLELNLERAEISGLGSVGSPQDSLSLGSVQLLGTGKGKTFKIEKLESSGGDLDASGTGTVILTEPLGRSRLSLNLALRPGQALDKGLADLLGLFAKKNRDGSYRLRVGGTLAKPRI
ncbi:MAG: type II secretion system protein GspN [Desulfuromonas sp.]|uniref:type II secretion system protein GspN n=1 Tax=Desulfuromonas sp. TaxID=892 RepID=UPI000CB91C33|nr:type II secretion system protein GspN [Desulfuromonas sp.]PLX85328.1 MAG: type II secretion system protein GspN [Desulfuromonas sp.]